MTTPDIPPDVAAVLAELRAEMRTHRAAPPELAPLEDMTETTAYMLGCDTAVGRANWQRLSAWRAAGYTGPLDARGDIPDPDDPERADTLRTFAYMRART